ncbi:hypothetical protein FACS189485_09880 [Spirochaetia bacterium]|nr:hypothetical protein FACS189485_09880 [Spirochaetia bacterium]
MSIATVYRRLPPKLKTRLFVLKAILKYPKWFSISSYLHYKRYKTAEPPAKFPHYLSVVAKVKNEAPYIAEWIEYHLLQGCEKFYIYDNESTDNLQEALAPYIRDGIVEYTFFPGKKQHEIIYNVALKQCRMNTYWLLPLDIDEFIAPITSPTLAAFLHDFEGYPGVEINWLNYGSGGQEKKTPGLVIERFKDHAGQDCVKNLGVKSVINPRAALFILTHVAEYFDRVCSVNPRKEEIHLDMLDRAEPVLDTIRINHYFSKSFEEFLEKKKRGVASKGNAEYPTQHFYDHETNDIKNDPIMDAYIPLVKENLRRRMEAP